MEQRTQSAKSRSILPVPHTDVHHVLRRYLELAQDFIVASLAVVMLQGLWTLAQIAFVLGRAPSEILSQVILLFVLVELFRTLVIYLREHRVSVSLMLEVAVVSELRDVPLNQPTTVGPSLYANALLLTVSGSLLLAYRIVNRIDHDNAT